MKKGSGVTFQIVIGKYSKPEINFCKSSWRICLGWIAFSIIFYDMEVMFTEMMKLLKEKPITTTT